MRLGIIGNGVVGNATARSFIEHADEIRIYDIDPSKRTHAFEDVLQCDFTFVCVPTPDPARPKIVEDVVRKASAHPIRGPLIIKSTVVPGTTRHLSETYATTLLHSPEFLTARCAVVDAHVPARNIVGCLEPGAVEGDSLRLLYERRFPGVPCHVMRCESSEMVKLAANAFFSVKVAWFNELYDLCGDVGASWDDVLSGLLSDGRIAHAHTQVPHGGSRGYGGACLPKDSGAFASIDRSGQITRAAVESNRRIREESANSG